jgi:putative membrane protein insertion efficiency factor
VCEPKPHLATRRPLARALHWLYKAAFSWMFTGACRFSPTCSDYALQAIEIHGWIRGVWLAVRRVVRCHPYNPGGFDPVP